MKTKWYFIIPASVLIGFGAWYQDFHRRDVLHQELTAQRIQQQREAHAMARAVATAQARATAQAQAEQRHLEQQQKQAREEADQIARENVKAELASVREENSGLRTTCRRLQHDATAEESHLQALILERTAITDEARFLAHYLEQARASVARLNALVARIGQIPIAPSALPPARIE